ncbi:MAG: TolC family protein [Nostocaceae cyanobacterium]|nr:TolC family protein [Nostocaceae cyanobacterium]
MKGQQIFHTFLPGVTAAVLTTQPVWAENVKVSGIELSTTANNNTIIANKVNRQQPSTPKKNPTTVITPSRVSSGNFQLLSDSATGIMVTGKTGVPIKTTSATDKKAVLNLTPSLSNFLEKNRLGSAQNQQTRGDSLITTKKPQNEGDIIVNENVKPNVKPNSVESKTLPDAVGKKKPPNTAKSPGSAKLLNAVLKQRNCQQQSGSKQPPKETGNREQGTGTGLSEDLNPCQTSVTLKGEASEQGTRQQETTVKSCPLPVPSKATASVTVSDANCSQSDISGQPMAQTPTPILPETKQLEPNGSGSALPPDYLNPSPNPLQFPTKPGEVEVKGTQPITLEQALELAKRNNRQLQEALLQQQVAEKDVREAQAALYPTVDLTTQVSRQQSAGAQRQIEAGLAGLDTVTDTVNAQAELRYNLYTSGRRLANIRAAEEQLRFRELDVERIVEQIRLDVSIRYYDLQNRDEQVRINESAVRNAEASLKDAQALERAGVGTRFDVLRSQVNLANAQQQLTSAVAEQRVSRRELANLLSLSQGVDISAADPVKLAGLWNETLEDSIVKAFQNRPELQQNLTQRNINEQQRRAALANLGPQLSLVARYDLLDQFDDSVGVTDGYTVALQATLNLFDGGAAKARAAREKVEIAIAETQFAQQRNLVRVEVERQYFRLQANLENVQTANAALDQAKESLRLARLRFQAGVGTQTEVINAESDLTRAEGNRISAILEYNSALTRLQRAVTSRSSR